MILHWIRNLTTGVREPRQLPEMGDLPTMGSLMSMISTPFSAVDIHNNGTVVQFENNVRSDDGWSRANNQFTYQGEPNHVDIQVCLNAVDSGASSYWSRPKLRILRNGDVIAIMDDLCMQQNGTYDGDATIVGAITDPTPGEDPVYTFEWFDKDARTATLIPQGFSAVTLKAAL